MEILVIVRHGNYGDDDRLNDTGRKQMSEMAEKLRSFVGNMRTLVFSSPVDRAAEGAEIIAKALSVPLEMQEILCSERRHPHNYPGLLEMIRARQDEADCLILMTHLEYANGFADYFAKHEWDGVEVPYIGVAKGQGAILNIVQRTLVKIE